MSLALVTGGDSRLAGPSLVMFISILLNSRRLWSRSKKYFLCCEQVSKELIPVFDLLDISIVTFDPSSISEKEAGHFTKGLLSKFALLELTSVYEVVVWLDSDQVCIREATELLSKIDELSNYSSGAITINANTRVAGQFKPEYYAMLVDEFGLEVMNSEGMSGAIYAVKTNKKEITSYVSSVYNRLHPMLVLYDQGVYDIVLSDRRYIEKRLWLKGDMYTPHPTEISAHDRIRLPSSELPYFLHAYGSKKFWNGTVCAEWEYFYSIYLGIGGTPFKDSHIATILRGFRLALGLVKNRFHLFRRRLARS